MAIVRDVIKSKLDRLRERKQRLSDEITVLQAQIDALVAERDSLTPAVEARMDRLQALAVIEAKD